MKADRIFVNGQIYTVNDRSEWVEAVAIKGDRIIYAGDEEGARALCGENTEVTDLAGKMMLPGFIDGHCHPVLAAHYLCGVYLQIEWGVEECLAEIEKYVKANPDNET